VVLQEGSDIIFGEIRIKAQLALIPTCEPVKSADPQGAVACCQQRQDIWARETLARGWGPWEKMNTIEANEAELRAQPKITVRRLDN
jgi:hypothetical protein